MINSGWANNCGVELFTVGWVECPSTRRKGGPTHDTYVDYSEQIAREDEELLLIASSLTKVLNRWH